MLKPHTTAYTSAKKFCCFSEEYLPLVTQEHHAQILPLQTPAAYMNHQTSSNSNELHW